MEAPSEATIEQLDELGISVKKLAGGNEVFAKIKNELDIRKLKYKAFEHEPVKTSEDAAKVRNTPLAWGAKAILLYEDDKPMMVVVAADTKIDMKILKKFANIKDLRMATPDEVVKVTSVPIGAVPPFGHIFQIPLFMDKKIQRNEKIVFNAGLHTKSIEMGEADYEKVACPNVGEFSK